MYVRQGKARPPKKVRYLEPSPLFVDTIPMLITATRGPLLRLTARRVKPARGPTGPLPNHLITYTGVGGTPRPFQRKPVFAFGLN